MSGNIRLNGTFAACSPAKTARASSRGMSARAPSKIRGDVRCLRSTDDEPDDAELPGKFDGAPEFDNTGAEGIDDTTPDRWDADGEFDGDEGESDVADEEGIDVNNGLDVSAEDIESNLGRLPERAEGDKTHGIAVLERQEYPMQASGKEGLSQDIPRGTDGFNGNCKTHVEAHTAALMRQTGAKEGVLFVNNEPCKTPVGCDRNLPGMLPEGARVRVIGPDGFDKTYTGSPDKRK